MKTFIEGFNKSFESRVRLGIMSLLAIHESLEFNSLKDYLQVTDGNLASHLKALEKEKFIVSEKSFVGKKPNTKYFITNEGRLAFISHLAALEELLKSQK